MDRNKRSFWVTPQGLAALGLIAVAVYVLIIEHGQHLAPWLPFLILLLCPFMHIFMHGGHGGHGGHSEHHDKEEGDDLGEGSSHTDKESYVRGIEEGRRRAHKENHNAR